MNLKDRISLYLKKIKGRLIKQIIQKTDVHTNTETVNKFFEENMIPRNSDTLRIAFLFQIASFWPNWESFYLECLNDYRISVKMYLLKDEVNEHSQIQSAKKFLDSHDIKYSEYNDQNMDAFNPHVVVIQTPYDYDHRKPKHQTADYMKKGYRVIYIPYGIEIANTERSRRDHFFNPVVRNCWRVFVFSETIKRDYVTIGGLEESKIVPLGHPKFDRIRQNDKLGISDTFKKIENRKIVVWHIHFPKKITVNGKSVMCTPDLSEYFAFAKKIKEYKNLFFTILPHPKFAESLQGERFISIFDKQENCFVDWSDDYRPAIYSADFMITDRSSLMIEVAPRGIPILYMDNKNWHEPMTDAINPLMDSYYHGTECSDMIHFIDMCIAGDDMKKKERELAVNTCLSLCDGKSGQKIKDYLLNEVT